MIVHFICRGNVLRSFIAETYLRSLNIPGVEVMSSGIVGERDKARNSHNYRKNVALLKRHGLAAFTKDDYGHQVTQAGIDQSDLIVFMNPVAFKECSEQFVLPATAVVWEVDDIGEGQRQYRTEAERDQLREIVYQHVVAMVDELVRTTLRPRL
jgi:protein-tyrosine-phosphatase